MKSTIISWNIIFLMHLACSGENKFNSTSRTVQQAKKTEETNTNNAEAKQSQADQKDTPEVSEKESKIDQNQEDQNIDSNKKSTNNTKPCSDEEQHLSFSVTSDRLGGEEANNGIISIQCKNSGLTLKDLSNLTFIITIPLETNSNSTESNEIKLGPGDIYISDNRLTFKASSSDLLIDTSDEENIYNGPEGFKIKVKVIYTLTNKKFETNSKEITIFKPFIPRR
ncbi:MAG: hypothetical protein R3B45_00960 [Bdellovibrionota bacterium]